MSAPQLTADGTLVMPVQDSACELQPIIPCPEPESEAPTRLMPARLPSFSWEIARDPVVLPMGPARSSAAEWARLGLALLLSLSALGTGAAVALALI